MSSIFVPPPQISSSVPPEVWLRIFSLATDSDALLNCDSWVSSDLPRALVKQQESRCLKSSLCAKRSVALVCRTWNKLALEFLYRSILITKVAKLHSLYESLQEHALRAQDKNRHGWWTKRLDVLIDDQRCEASDYGALAALIRQFPNLVIITLSMPILPSNDCWLRQLPAPIIVSLAETCGTSLQVFDCSDSILRPCRQVEDLILLLIASPNLRVLRCPICSPTPIGRASRNRLDVPVMPKLESITLMSVFLRDYLPRDRDTNHLPALRQLTYDCIPPPFFDHLWRNFVKLTCASLTSVILDFCLPGDTLQSELNLLSECCAVLDRLVIYLRSWRELKPRLVLPPVSYLGLHSKTLEGQTFQSQALISALATLIAPRLRIVRLLHANVAKELHEKLTLWAGESDRTRLTSESYSFSLEDLKDSKH